MPNPFKYSTSTPSNALRKGNVAVGVNNVEYGPTSTTGWYSGIDIPEGGYVVYTIGLNNNPKTWVAQDDNDLPAIARTLGGGDLTILESKIFLNAHANTWILSNIPPNIVTDGLVYYSDGGDMTSFMNNEPTTNVVADPLPTTGWSVAAGTQGSALTRTYLEEDGKPFMRFSGVTNGNDYPRVTNSVFANSATITGTFSTSLEVRGTAGAVLRFRIYENGSTKITNTITLTSEWTRYTFDNQTTGFNLNQPYFNPATSDAIYDIRNIQVEAKSHATPFTAGTRSQNTLLNDLSGESNNGTLTNGPTFNTNGWFDFDGTDDEIIVADDSTLDLTTDMSFEFLFKASSSQNNLYPRLIDKSSWLVHILQTPPFGIYQNVNTSAGLRQTGTTSNIIQADTWTHVISNYDGQIGKIYINGNLVRTQDFGSELPCTVNGTVVTIGGNTGTDRQLNGSIAKTKIYNKALSESEVSQNYYQAPIVTDGLVFAVDAGNLVSYENGSATTYSLTGSVSGTLTNGVGFDSTNGGGWVFDGVDDYITYGNPIDTQYTYADDFSLEVWINPDALSGFKHLIGKTYGNYRLAQNGAGISFRLDTNILVTQTGTLIVGEWTHIVATYEASTKTARVYQDGILQTTGTNSNLDWTTGDGNFQLGTSPGESYYFDGKISIGRAYSKTLTSAEVSQNYNAQSSRFI
jgi:hypothetical protein